MMDIDNEEEEDNDDDDLDVWIMVFTWMYYIVFGLIIIKNISYS